LKPPRWLAAAPAAFVLIWSTGYIVAKAAAPHAEPLTFLLLRYVGVVIMMALLAVWAKARWPTWREAAHLAVAGLGIQAMYLAGVWVAIAQGMPAGVSALIVNLQPVLTAALGFVVHESVSKRQWVGVALGLAGVVLVVWHKLGTTGLQPWTVGLCVGALLGMTLGTLYQKRFVPQFDLRTGQVVQFVAATLATLPLAWATESLQVSWSTPLVVALLWSVVVLSGVGISLMFVMLRHGEATRVTSAMYLVPSVTALMAYALFGESLGPTVWLGMLVSLLGVYLVVKRGQLLKA
jgi:drug/metabolite transporter (DMT)-like permease